MRASNRIPILDAAVRIAEQHGFGGVTMEVVAEEAGLTKGGLMYHFGCKDALLLGIQHHLADGWERELEQLAGKTAAECTPRERMAAYVRVSAKQAIRAELVMQLEAANDATLSEPWTAVFERWRPAAESDPQDAAGMTAQVALLAADGLWTIEALGVGRLDEAARTRIIEHLVGLLEDGAG